MIESFSILLIITLLISTISFISFQKYFISKGHVDKTNHRSSHNVVATRSGGIAILLSIFIVSIYFYLVRIEIYDFSILVPLTLLSLVGLYDDINKLDFKLKFLFQVVVAKIIIDNGLIIDNLHGVFGVYEISRIVAQLLTIFIIVAIINSINFIDGIDGLAISIVGLFIVLFEFFSIKTTPLYNFSIILLISILPLYYFNFKKNNKIFLGDSGSMFLGGIISIYVLTILSNLYIIKPEFDIHKIIFVISILVYPIVDIIRISFKRILSGKSPFEADKNHIHHIILNKLKIHSYTTMVLVFTSLLFTIFTQLLF